MIDLHCHLLPGVDDGPPALDDSLALAEAARDGGTRLIVATPHLDYSWGVDAAAIGPAVEKLQPELANAGIDVELRAGAEIALTRVADLSDEELESVKLGHYLLVESPLEQAGGDIEGQLFALRMRGHELLLAHPERCPIFHRSPELLERLVQGGTLCSVTASALTGRFGTQVRRFAAHMLAEDMVHSIDSDAHDLSRRGPEILPHIEEAARGLPGLDGLTAWLTEEVPAAILAGDHLPPRPGTVSAPRRRRWLRRA